MTSDPYAAFRAAVETGDVDAAVALFIPDAVFHSPVVHRPYVGREALRAILAAVTGVFEDFRYTGSYGGDEGHVLRFAARVGDRDLEGVDILRGVGGQLTELTVMVRPYSAATALRERMAALLAP
ncbi:nuclear transport factor 2 family protein [Pseudonocardia sp.]|uniref:nuclear transport factor 2 family protein n=1 Tax=Pseudonocardia sp. TaxID=60912 RepID=UPI002601D037|nr:nuclear transport factor 2 family protein [Pseudonocardia sp.]